MFPNPSLSCVLTLFSFALLLSRVTLTNGQESTPISSCSQTFTGMDSGVILSPGFPDTYADDEFCNYAVVVPSDKQVNLTFILAALEQRKEQLLDYIVIFDGVDCMSKRIAAVVDTSTPTFISSGNSLVALFSSDATHRRSPFVAEFSTVTGQTPTEPVSPPPVNYILAKCGQEINDESGSLSYRGELGWNHLCIWKISVGTGKKIHLNFTTIRITYGGSWLRVLDGGDCAAPTIYFRPGLASVRDVELISTSNSLMIVYAALAGRITDRLELSYYTENTGGRLHADCKTLSMVFATMILTAAARCSTHI
ncbi:unnamed protein product [Dicrocoelium dendriticum]|nr:unnamed protein product [Dicrocoelium dendriticum]